MFAEIIRMIFSSESISVGILIIIIILYKEIVRPRLRALDEYEQKNNRKLDDIMSKEQMILLLKDNSKEILNSSDLTHKIQSITTHITQTSDQILGRLEDVKIQSKNIQAELYKQKSILESLQLNFSEHDSRIYDDKTPDEIKEMLNATYTLIDKAIAQLEEKDLIVKIERVDFNSSSLSPKDVKGILQIMERLSPRDRRRGSKLNRINTQQEDNYDEQV